MNGLLLYYRIQIECWANWYHIQIEQQKSLDYLKLKTNNSKDRPETSLLCSFKCIFTELAKDYGVSCNIFSISAELLFKNILNNCFAFWQSELSDIVSVSLLHLSSAGKNKVDSFGEGKILYWIGLKQNLQCVGKCHKWGKCSVAFIMGYPLLNRKYL
jgi:hypothetical protein